MAGRIGGCFDRMHSMIEPPIDRAIALRLRRLLARATDRYRPLQVDGQAAGWITPARCRRLADFVDVFEVRDDAIAFIADVTTPAMRTAALERVTRVLAREGALSAWRDERYAVGPTLAGAPWFLLERAAARYFGVHSWAVHGNGLVRDGDSVRMWLARRSLTKAIDPGMLDNLVGGGVPAGMDPQAAFIKEAWEEAGLPPPIAAAAVAAGALHIRRDTAGGLQWETIFVSDVTLPADRMPANQDGEAIEHRCVSLAEAARLIALDAGPDQVTPDASLVILDALVRLGAMDAHGDAAATLTALAAAP
jgi:8-oxo-dGTP pyrophosphatase MutT (NUDIX family)